MPSTGEGFGIVFLQAMATGVRVIAGSQDGSRDALCDGALGTLVDPENCEELASAILAALDNPARTGDRTTRFKPDLFSGASQRTASALLRSKGRLSRGATVAAKRGNGGIGFERFHSFKTYSNVPSLTSAPWCLVQGANGSLSGPKCFD